MEECTSGCGSPSLSLFFFSVNPRLLLLLLWAGPYAPSNYQGYFLQRAKSLFMGMSVCHKARRTLTLSATPKKRKTLRFSATAVARFCFAIALKNVIFR